MEIEGSVVSGAYHYVILQFTGFQHYVQTVINDLEQRYGDHLTVHMVENHLKLNPFLDEAEYSHIEQDMLDDFANADERPSTSTGLHEEDLDDRPSTSTGLYEEAFDNWPPTLSEQSQQDPGESPSRLWKQNLGDLQDLNEEIDTLARENDRERRLESGISLKQKIIKAANNEKEEGEIGAYYEKNGDNPPDSPPDNSDPDQKEDN